MQRVVFIDVGRAVYEEEVAAFRGTDAETPATVTLDGVWYRDGGVRF